MPRPRSKRRKRLVLATIAVAVAIAFGSFEARPQAPWVAKTAEEASARPSPAGEVPFDHQIHAGQYKIPCLDCHAFADKSPVAGLPSGRKCMGCHKFVGKDKPSVQLLAKRFEDGQPLVWTRVFAVPDFVYFSHRMHVGAKVECKECHGDVASEKTVQQSEPFTMGRCLECHEARNASRDCLACHK
jgi:Cytochrome c7 and related cytochrome c/Class III cytochrome C family